MQKSQCFGILQKKKKPSSLVAEYQAFSLCDMRFDSHLGRTYKKGKKVLSSISGRIPGLYLGDAAFDSRLKGTFLQKKINEMLEHRHI